MPIRNPSGYYFPLETVWCAKEPNSSTLCAGHLADYGSVVAIGARNIKAFQQALLDHGTRLPKTVLSISGVYFEQIAALTLKVAELEITLRRETAREGQAMGNPPIFNGVHV